MPTYDYLCKSCNHKFEEFHGINAEPEISCPECDTKRAKKLISGGAGLIFKGTGFYITDYKDNNNGEKVKSSPKINTDTKKSDKAEKNKAEAKAV